MNSVAVMTTFSPPENAEDQERWRVSIDDAMKSVHVGWVDKYGFYFRPDLGGRILLNPAHLNSIVNHILFLRYIEEEKNKPC